MRTMSMKMSGRNGLRRRLAVFAILALTLVSAALDRRNVVFGRDTGETGVVEHQGATPTVEALVREMLAHD